MSVKHSEWQTDFRFQSRAKAQGVRTPKIARHLVRNPVIGWLIFYISLVWRNRPCAFSSAATILCAILFLNYRAAYSMSYDTPKAVVRATPRSHTNRGKSWHYSALVDNLIALPARIISPELSLAIRKSFVVSGLMKSLRLPRYLSEFPPPSA